MLLDTILGQDMLCNTYYVFKGIISFVKCVTLPPYSGFQTSLMSLCDTLKQNHLQCEVELMQND